MKLHTLLSERPIAFYPALRKITGSITAAIMLQQLLYWWDKRSGKTLYKTVADMEAETSLTEKEQRTAIRVLKAAGFIDVSVKGVPPTRNFIVHIDAINDALMSQIKSAQRAELNPPKGRNQICPKGGNNTETTTETTTDISPPLIPPQGGKRSKRKRGTRFNDSEHGGIVLDDWLAWAQNEGMPPEAAKREAAKFTDYWASVPGQRGVKIDWAATWRNWIRRAMETGSYQVQTNQGGHEDDFDAYMQHLAGIVAAAGEEGSDGSAGGDSGADASARLDEEGEGSGSSYQAYGDAAPALPSQRRSGGD